MTTPDQVGTPDYRVDRAASAIEQLVERLGAKLGAKASVTAVYGEPIERDGVTVIPIARVSLGFGVGVGRGQGGPDNGGEGGGGGGGGSAVPLGYLEIKDGSVTFKRILHPVIDVALPLALAMIGTAAPPLLRRFAKRSQR